MENFLLILILDLKFIQSNHNVIMLYSNFLKQQIKIKKGMTLIELTVYVGILGVIAVFTSNFLIQIVTTYQRSRVEREVITNARLLLETVTKSIAYAQETYPQASNFNANLGQLSLITTIQPPTEHTTKYIDFWIDSGRAFIRMEGEVSTPLSSPAVAISQFRFEHIYQGLGRESVKFTLRVDSANARFPSSITLNSTTALRGNY